MVFYRRKVFKNSVVYDIKQVEYVMQNILFRQYNLTVLAVEDASPTTITGPQDVFSMTGVLYEMSRGMQPTPYFNVTIATEDGKPVRCFNNLIITPHCAMEDCRPDIVVIPRHFEY